MKKLLAVTLLLAGILPGTAGASIIEYPSILYSLVADVIPACINQTGVKDDTQRISVCTLPAAKRPSKSPVGPADHPVAKY